MTKRKDSNNGYGTRYYTPKRLKFPGNKTPRKDSAIGGSQDYSTILAPEIPEHTTYTAHQNFMHLLLYLYRPLQHTRCPTQTESKSSEFPYHPFQYGL